MTIGRSILMLSGDGAGGFEAVHAGHHDVHEDDVRLLGFQVLDAIFARSDPVDLDAALK
jgi:hypothetical protein